MNRKQLIGILAEYDTGEILYTAPLAEGSQSHAWRIDGEKGSWILRRCRNIRAAADEYAVLEALREKDITADAVMTKDGERFAVGDAGSI